MRAPRTAGGTPAGAGAAPAGAGAAGSRVPGTGPEAPGAAQAAPLAGEPGTESAAGRRRIFFALWPDEATRGAITRAVRRVLRLCGGRPTAKRNLHITVAFLGMATEADLEDAASVPPLGTGPFDLALDVLGHFQASRVLWLAPSVVPPELTALERELWAGLTGLGFEREQRAYRPHLTLARRARAVEEKVAPVRWRVESLTLVESLPVPGGVHYEPLREWPL